MKTLFKIALVVTAFVAVETQGAANVHAQASGIVAVEITVLSKQSKPLSGATAYLYQSIPPGSGASTGAFTDASGVATILAPELAETDGNVVDVLCMDKRAALRPTHFVIPNAAN